MNIVLLLIRTRPQATLPQLIRPRSSAPGHVPGVSAPTICPQPLDPRVQKGRQALPDVDDASYRNPSAVSCHTPGRGASWCRRGGRHVPPASSTRTIIPLQPIPATQKGGGDPSGDWHWGRSSEPVSARLLRRLALSLLLKSIPSFFTWEDCVNASIGLYSWRVRLPVPDTSSNRSESFSRVFLNPVFARRRREQRWRAQENCYRR